MSDPTNSNTPIYTGTDPSAICSLLMSDQLLTGFFRDHFMRHFNDSSLIEEPDLRSFIWKPGEETGILIESVHRWTPALTEHRPGIIVKRNDFDNQRLATFGERRQGQPADIYGNPHYNTFWVGSHTLFCIGSTGTQAELLGTEVQRELTQFAPEFIRALNLLRMQVIKRGAVGRVEEARENWVCPIVVGTAYEEIWITRKEAPRVKNISLSLLAEV